MKKKWMIALIILTAAVMRAPLTGVGALVNTISEQLSLSAGTAGALTTIPLIFFAVISPLVTFANSRIGAGNVLAVGMAFLSLGVFVRSLGGYYGLFIGVAVTGVGIAVANVMLPGIIKAYFPDKIESMTRLYTSVMQLVSAMATAVSVPLSYEYGWNGSLFVWFFVCLAALAACMKNRKIKMQDTAGSGIRLMKSTLTWWISAYMGCQSLIFYSFIAWLSPVLKDRGYDALNAGYLLSVYVIMGILGSCALTLLMKKNSSQSATGVQLGLLYLAGLLLFMFFEDGMLLYMGIAVCGFCSGLCVSFSMTLFGMHTKNGEDATALSGIGQSIGYLIAAIGPVLLGRIYWLTDSWLMPLLILTFISMFLVIAGCIVGKEKII